MVARLIARVRVCLVAKTIWMIRLSLLFLMDVRRRRENFQELGGRGEGGFDGKRAQWREEGRLGDLCDVEETRNLLARL